MSNADSDVAAGSFSGTRLLLTSVIVVIVAFGAYLYGVKSVETPEVQSLWMTGLDSPVEHRLDAKFSDADNDLIADPPKDESQWLDPPTINLSYLATEQDHYADVWSEFASFLGEKCGREVVFVKQETPDAQLSAIQSGDVHLAGVNSGSVPLAVNDCGFVPVYSFGKDDKLSTYTMKIIARNDSSIQKVEDIRGRRLALNNPTSNSGWKAPMVMLLHDYKLKPLIDYDIVGMWSHAKSAQAIASGEQEVAAIASDELELARSRGEIKLDDFKVIYESDPFCNNVLGHVYNLKPDLANTIRQAIEEFDWQDSKISEEFITFGVTQFVPVDYKKDFDHIRRIHNAMGRRYAVQNPADVAITTK